jgi:hypothetical protein
LIRASNGGNQFATHSQCASNITITSPLII